jgi:pyrimidine-specific ribonucleoside hydrolase
MINIAFDMETQDPDDVMTLCLLSNHPKVNLVAVTITPGSTHQVGLVKHILAKLNKNIPVGSRDASYPKDCVSVFHYNWLGKIVPEEPDGTGARVLQDAITKYPDLTIVCGASLGNIANFLDLDVKLNTIVVQGGFAGDNIMPPELVLPKFKGKITCPTFNLGGDMPAALKVLASDKISKRYFVSKNVCHGVIYDQEMHDFMTPHKDKNIGLALLYNGMDRYLNKKSSGKAFHDPLAACVAIDKSVCRFEEVELYKDKGEWGSRRSDNLNAFISIQADMDKFKKTIIGD